MTERDSFDISETKLRIFARDNWTCRNCGGSVYRHQTPQLAHGISQTKSNLKKYGPEIIHSDHNLYSCCGLSCNCALAVGKSNEARKAERIKNLIGALDVENSEGGGLSNDKSRNKDNSRTKLGKV